LSDTLVGAGVAFTGVLLGILASLGVRTLDIRRQDAAAKRDLLGYLETVIAEMNRNQIVLEHVVANNADVADLAVSDVAYRAAELVIARELPWSVLDVLQVAYAPITTGQLYSWTFVYSGLEVTSYRRVDLAVCADLAVHLKQAQTTLRDEALRLKPGLFRDRG
jgi:hypothetical protein